MRNVTRIPRRRLIAASSAALTVPWLGPMPLMAQGQGATPEPAASPIAGESEPSLADRVLAIEPEALLQRLLSAPADPMLFPGGVGAIGVEPWEDDADVEGTVGAVLLSGTAAPLLGAVLVFPDAGAARERVDRAVAEAEAEGAVSDARFLDIVGVTTRTMFGPVTLLPVGYVVAWGWGFPMLNDEALAEATPGATPDPSVDSGYRQVLEIRSITHAVAVLGHVQAVVAGEATP